MKEEIQQIQVVYNVLVEFFVNYSFQIVGALIIFAIGFYVANKTSKFVGKICERNKVDVTLTTFIVGFTKILIIVMVSIICLGKLGISITPMIALIGAASLGAGMAFQGLLSNYAAGFTIILARPFVVGDTIQINEVSGLVKEITLSMTILEDEDQVEITVPNKKIVGEIYYNSKANKLVEGCVGVEYGADPAKAIGVIETTIQNIPEVGDNPKPQIGIDEFGDSSINLGYRFWAPTTRYFETKYKVNLAIFQALQKEGISIPFPQREVRLLPEEKD